MVKKLRVGPSAMLPDTAVTCDAEVFRALARDEVIHVSSDSQLATWLKTIAYVRGWHVEEVQSARSWLLARFSKLAPYASLLVPDNEAANCSSVFAWAQLKLGFPSAPRPSLHHAEAVARWRLGQLLSQGEGVLLECVLDEFADAPSTDAYRIASHASQDEIVEHLVGVRSPVLVSKFRVYEEPHVANAIEAWTLKQLSASGPGGLRVALTSEAAIPAKTEVAKAYALAVRNGLPADAALFELVHPYLDGQHLTTLREACPPTPPSEVPDDFSELGQWFESSYLPYRRWMHARQIASDDVVAPIWDAFSKVYLAAIRDGIGSGKGPLAMHRVRAIDSDARSALLLILDGPLPDDTSALFKRFRSRHPQWTIVNSEWLLAAVPTVTEVCRPSMTAGVAAAFSEDEGDAVTSLAKAKALLEANAHLVIVKLLQPDRAYETLSVNDSTLKRLARSQLDMIADELSDICDDLPIDRIILCADHGRCLGRVEPTVDRVSEGKVHRRAILQVPRDSGDVPPGSVRLNGELYGFDSQGDAVVALGATTFKGVPEVWYPHGGLLPEEGFVHWMELRKAPMDLLVSGHVEQHGIEGQGGQLHVSVENHSIVALHLVRVCWKMDKEDIEIDAHSIFVPPATTMPIILDLPSLFDRVSEVATLELKAPDGQIRAIAVPFTTLVRKMQKQNIDLLGDL